MRPGRGALFGVLLLVAGCVQVEQISRASEARVQWSGASNWVPVVVPRRIQPPSAGAEATVECTIPATWLPDVHVAVVARYPLRVAVAGVVGGALDGHARPPRRTRDLMIVRASRRGRSSC